MYDHWFHSLSLFFPIFIFHLVWFILIFLVFLFHFSFKMSTCFSVTHFLSPYFLHFPLAFTLIKQPFLGSMVPIGSLIVPVCPLLWLQSSFPKLTLLQRRWRRQVPSKLQYYLFTKLHAVTSPKNIMFTVTAVGTSNLLQHLSHLEVAL
jgi:uncharacterized membrane protein YhaH (DUF805 family)